MPTVFILLTDYTRTLHEIRAEAEVAKQLTSDLATYNFTQRENVEKSLLRELEYGVRQYGPHAQIIQDAAWAAYRESLSWMRRRPLPEKYDISVASELESFKLPRWSDPESAATVYGKLPKTLVTEWLATQTLEHLQCLQAAQYKTHRLVPSVVETEQGWVIGDVKVTRSEFPTSYRPGGNHVAEEVIKAVDSRLLSIHPFDPANGGDLISGAPMVLVDWDDQKFIQRSRAELDVAGLRARLDEKIALCGPPDHSIIDFHFSQETSNA